MLTAQGSKDSIVAVVLITQ